MVKSIFHPVSSLWKKSTLMDKFLYISIIIILFHRLLTFTKKDIETFEEPTESFINKKDIDIYDDFYVSIYDDLLFSTFKNDFEIGLIENKTKPSEKSLILDIGSGTGHHVGELTKRGYKCQGLDVSSSMVKAAKQKYPDCTFTQGNVLKSITFHPEEFTHITCLYFTIYTIRNKRPFFQNCMQWLKPGGYLILHLVDRDKFDPILPVADVMTSINPQKYAKKRLTTTQAVFKNHLYKANFDIKNDKAEFTETFTNKKNGSVRKHTHKLYMETQKQILSLAQGAGFIMISQNEMKKVGYYNQYIYVLQKPK